MITEDQLEQQCLGGFRDGGWETVFGPDIAHDGAAPERANDRELGDKAEWLPLLQSLPSIDSPA